ncbi:signal peptidase I [Armatimonas sp.]|uniref:signal peptidase I n=1 Tax=Armatimonas sp. TaxID=1872638 RepID=UPI00286A342C|nr:signal peptidase I [Armatimonas sp.]
MNDQPIPLTDQLANISPTIVVAVIAGFTVLRLMMSKLLHESWARTLSEICDTVTFVLALAFLLIRPFVAQAFYIPSESMVPTLQIGDRLIVDKISFRFHDPERGDILVFAAPPEATGSPTLEQDYIKRCIGLPGEKVEVRGAKLRVGKEVFEAQGEDTNADVAHQTLRDRLGISREKSVKFFKDYVLINGTEKLMPQDIARQFGQPGAEVELTPGVAVINGKPLEDTYTNEDPGYNMNELEIPPSNYFMMGDNRNRSADSHVWGKLEGRRIVGRGIVTFWPLTRLGRLR